ncbi:hypothetical protein IG193_07655 [Infirmifilum lucidum]|uniref:Uncharacterized protein n=1 Tax=Infirmifilum lucidum TaxID=2776706 RepID=A0A7L9FI75_9CREN|nr:hypothetical protein [Infirmifilum lucidum]QOJ78624.1 hypothetical protein IG193_07655 [Infirmifilum lucidum]
MPPEADIISQVLLALQDVVSALPRVLLATVIILATFIILRLVNRAVKWLVSAGRLEEVIRGIVPEGTRISLTTIFTALADAAILVASSATLIKLYVPEGTPFYRELVGYLARAGSVVVLALLALVMVDAVVKSMRLERKTERFFVMLTSLLLVILVVDLAALSNEVKIALTAGLALGVGLLIGVFSFWALFGDYIEEAVALLRSRRRETLSRGVAEQEIPPE